jgi:Yip1 domain
VGGLATRQQSTKSNNTEENMNIVQRVQDILLKPKETWPVIEQEPADTASIYKNYLVILAAIPAIASFIGLTLIGVGAFGVHVRVPLLAGLVNLVVGYVLSLVMVFVLALVVDALAPTFGGTKNQLNALKLVAYAGTAGFVGGIFSLLPSLAVLGLLAALYSIYLIYTGLPVLMKNPADKSVAYTVVVIVCGIVAGAILAAVTSLLSPGMRGMQVGSMGSSDGVTLTTPGGEIAINTAKLEAMSKKMEQAQASGDTAAAGKAAADMLGSLAGANGVPMAAQDLKALLPEQLGDYKRESVEAQSNAAMGLANSSATAGYVNGDKHLRLSITDIGGASGLMAVAGWAGMTMDKETNDRIEKVYKQGKRTVREDYRKDGSGGEFTVVLENGVIVTAEGVDIASLKNAVNAVNLGKLETTQRAAKT